jgi:hypothetical protein
MFTERLFQFTLAISILIHGAIILPRANFNPFRPAPKIQKIAVRYIKENPQLRPLPNNLSEPERQKLMPKP